MPLPPLYPYQLETIERAMRRRGSLAVFHEPGLGKTRTCLEIYLRLKAEEPTLKALVVCPRSLIKATWIPETIRWTNVTACALADRDPTANIAVINYEKLIRPSGWQLFEESAWIRAPLLLILDESSRLKDPNSLTTKTLLPFAESCVARLLCSGTPTPNGLWELWAQLKIVDPKNVHHSFYAWRREYFHLRRGTQLLPSPPGGRLAMQQLFRAGWSWDISHANRDRLLARAAPLCSWIRKAEVMPQLPDRLFVTRQVTLSTEERRAYERMRRQLVVEFQEEVVTADIALTKLMKLRQITSGFLYGETVHGIGHSRLLTLREVLDEFGEQPIVIWCQFREELHQLQRLLGERAVLYESDHSVECLARFGKDRQYLLAHPRSAGHGLTLTQASVCVWYSLDWSLEMYQQANDRLHRLGQTKGCLYVHLLAPGTIDEQLWEVLQQKTSLQTAIDRSLRNGPASRHCPRPSETRSDTLALAS